jgi:hypothetical protein
MKVREQVKEHAGEKRILVQGRRVAQPPGTWEKYEHARGNRDERQPGIRRICFAARPQSRPDRQSPAEKMADADP